MFDFFSSELTLNPEEILSNPILNFTSPVNIDTGEIVAPRNGYTKRTAFYNGLKIDYVVNHKTNKNSFTLSGSLHKYFHNGINCNDFKIKEVKESIYELCKLLNIDTSQIKIHRIEFGVNISPSYPTNEILNSLLFYRSQPYELREFNNSGYLKQFVFNQYIVKVYNKGLQYGLSNDLMRFELKVNTMDYLLKKGIQIRCIDDLLKTQIHIQLRELLTKTFESILFYDYRIKAKLITSKRDKQLLIECSNPMFWERFKEDHSATAYKKKVKRFKELVLKYSPSDLQKEISKQILDKWNELKSYPILSLVENNTVTQNDTHIVPHIGKQDKRYCLTCGRDISHQKPESKFCSEKLYGPEVKKCRNINSNPRNNFKKKLSKILSGPQLFDSSQYLKLSEQQRYWISVSPE